jgi:hypothetical protein
VDSYWYALLWVKFDFASDCWWLTLTLPFITHHHSLKSSVSSHSAHLLLCPCSYRLSDFYVFPMHSGLHLNWLDSCRLGGAIKVLFRLFLFVMQMGWHHLLFLGPRVEHFRRIPAQAGCATYTLLFTLSLRSSCWNLIWWEDISWAFKGGATVALMTTAPR